MKLAAARGKSPEWVTPGSTHADIFAPTNNPK
jgi:hypothetical protein